MNSDFSNRLEKQVDRLLKMLPNLQAPPSLAAEVMRRIAERHELPWYHRPWQSWAPPLRIASMTFLILSFGGLCFASWRLTQAAGYATAAEEVRQVFSGITVIWNTLTAVLNAIVLAFHHLSTGVMLACMLAAAFSYTLCVGLGTICVRLALVRRN